MSNVFEFISQLFQGFFGGLWSVIVQIILSMGSWLIMIIIGVLFLALREKIYNAIFYPKVKNKKSKKNKQR